MTCLFGALVPDVLVLAVCVLAAVYVYFKVSFNYWKKRNVPYAKTTFPFGNLGDMVFLKSSLGHYLKTFTRNLTVKSTEEHTRLQRLHSYFVIRILLKMFS